MNGVVVGGLYDSGLTLYTNERFSFDSLRAGLLFLSFVGPGFVIQPLAGRWADRYGAWAVGLVGLACVVPTVALLAILAPLPAFVVLLVLQGAASSVILPALALDLHQTVESTPGLGFAHAYSMCVRVASVDLTAQFQPGILDRSADRTDLRRTATRPPR